MIKSVAPYIGKYKKYRVIASFLTTLGIIANVLPYFILYQLIVRFSYTRTRKSSCMILIR